MSSLKRIVSLSLTLIFAALFVVFAVSNREFVALKFFPLPYTVEIPKFLLALICFAFGLVIGGLMLSVRLARVRRLLKAEHRRADALVHENKALRMESAERIAPQIAS